MEQISIGLNPEQIQQLNQEAVKLSLSRSSYIKLLIARGRLKK